MGRPDKEVRLPLGRRRAEVLHLANGEKFAYVVDAAYHHRDVDRIPDLTWAADQLFIEAVFLDEDAVVASQSPLLPATTGRAYLRRTDPLGRKLASLLPRA